MQVSTASGYAYANRIGSFVISLSTLAILARLLPPSEFGLAAMTTTTMGLLATFRELGLTSAAIQTPNLSFDDRNALFWFNAAFTIAVTGLALVCAPFVAQFYNEPRVKELLYMAAASFLLSGMSTQHNALLRRDLRLRATFIADLGGLLMGSTLSILAAAYLANATSIMLGAVAQAAFTTILTIILAGWLPGRPREIRRHFQHAIFGAHVSLFGMLNYVTNNIGTVLVGRWLDPTSMGHFSRAQSLYSLPVNFVLSPYLQVQFPLLCRAYGNPKDTRRIYSNVLLLTGLIFVPAGLTLPFVAIELTRLVLGNQWAQSGAILTWLSPALIALGIVGPFGQFMTSQARVKELGLWGFADLGLRGGGTAIGALYGPTEAAAGFSITTLCLATPMIVWLTVRIGCFRARDYLSASAPGLIIGSAILVSLLLARHTLDIVMERGPRMTIALLAVASVVWIAATLAVPKSRRALRAIFSGRTS